jgi:hypothetical protein
MRNEPPQDSRGAGKRIGNEELREALRRFRRAEPNHRHWSRAFHYTDGVAFLAEHAGIHWFLDFIAAHHKRMRKDAPLGESHSWTLRQRGRLTVRVTCKRDESREAFHADVQLFGDCAVGEVTVVYEGGIVRLPHERRM